MNHTSRMATLLGRLRREMNGAVAERFDNALPPALRYGLNLGVSLPTIRTIAREEGHDHDFAKYLYRQDVRELRLASLWIAEPDRVTEAELPFWMEGRMPAEGVEELAFALLSRTAVLPSLLPWLERPEPGYAYAAVMSLARGTGYDRAEAVRRVGNAIALRPDDLQLAQGAAVLLTVLAGHEENRPAVLALVDSSGDTPAGAFLREEMAWRLEI